MASSTTTDIAALGSLAPLIINMLKGSNQPNPGALLGTIPGGQDLLNSVVGQQQQQAPLRQAVTQQAMNMLPNSAFPGGRPALSPVGAGPAPVSGGGSGSDLAKLLAAGGAGAGLGALLSKLANGGSGGGGPLGDLLKKLFGRGGPGVQGNKPNAGGALTGPSAFDPNMFMGWDMGDGYGPQNDYGPSPQGTVTTDTQFNGIPGGYPDNPEEPNSVDPGWGGLTGGTPGEPSSEWGG